MPAERKPGSNLGRSIIDWDEAFLHYASLPPDQRSYRAVADQFGVSVRTVERHGRDQRWKEQARGLDRSAAKLAVERLRNERVESLIDTEKLVQASMVTLASQLRAGTVKVRPADLPGLHKLRTVIWEQADSYTEDETVTQQPVDVGDRLERKREVLRALDDAGVLQQLLGRTGDCHHADPENAAADGEVAS
jgi:hypothetical protein